MNPTQDLIHKDLDFCVKEQHQALRVHVTRTTRIQIVEINQAATNRTNMTLMF